MFQQFLPHYKVLPHMKFINLVQTLTPKLTKRISRMYRYNVENSSEEANFAKVYNL